MVYVAEWMVLGGTFSEYVVIVVELLAKGGRMKDGNRDANKKFVGVERAAQSLAPPANPKSWRLAFEHCFMCAGAAATRSTAASVLARVLRELGVESIAPPAEAMADMAIADAKAKIATATDAEEGDATSAAGDKKKKKAGINKKKGNAKKKKKNGKAASDNVAFFTRLVAGKDSKARLAARKAALAEFEAAVGSAIEAADEEEEDDDE